MDKTAVLERFGKFRKFLVLKLATRLIGASLDVKYGKLERMVGLIVRNGNGRLDYGGQLGQRSGGSGLGGDQRIKPPAETVFLFNAYGGLLGPRSLFKKWIFR
jgi:hypothetical protein